jgi:hypothetical protein
MSIQGFPYDILHEWPPNILLDAPPIIHGLL